MLAEALKTYPATGSLNTEISDLDEVRPIFTDLVNDLRKLVKKQAEHFMLPMECHYLNKAALVSLVGQQPQLVEHFTAKRKPKSAILRAELLQKSTDAASNLKKSSAPVIPVRSRGMPRKMTDTSKFRIRCVLLYFCNWHSLSICCNMSHFKLGNKREQACRLMCSSKNLNCVIIYSKDVSKLQNLIVSGRKLKTSFHYFHCQRTGNIIMIRGLSHWKQIRTFITIKPV